MYMYGECMLQHTNIHTPYICQGPRLRESHWAGRGMTACCQITVSVSGVNRVVSLPLKCGGALILRQDSQGAAKEFDRLLCRRRTMRSFERLLWRPLADSGLSKAGTRSKRGIVGFSPVQRVAPRR